jgi:hypothetical protein
MQKVFLQTQKGFLQTQKTNINLTTKMPYANIQATLTDADLLDIYNHIDQSKLKLPRYKQA